MSAVFYNKYKNLFFDDSDPEPLSMNYFGVRPKNSININPSPNLASLAQHYNILPKDFEIPRAKVEEIYSVPTKSQSHPTKLDPLPFKPPLPAFESRPKQPALEYSPEPPIKYRESPLRANSIQKLPPIPQETFKYNETAKVQPEVYRQPSEVAKVQPDAYRQPNEVTKVQPEVYRQPENRVEVEKNFIEAKKQKYEQTKANIFPDKVENVKVLNPYQEALKNRKDAKGRLSERKQRLKDLLNIDGVLGERKF